MVNCVKLGKRITGDHSEFFAHVKNTMKNTDVFFLPCEGGHSSLATPSVA